MHPKCLFFSGALPTDFYISLKMYLRSAETGDHGQAFFQDKRGEQAPPGDPQGFLGPERVLPHAQDLVNEAVERLFVSAYESYCSAHEERDFMRKIMEGALPETKE